MNDRAALDLLAAHGPLTRARIGELTGLSKPTVSQVLGRLQQSRLVRATGSATGGRPGPSAQLYEVDPEAGHVAALAVDPEGITACVADITGRVTGRSRVRHDAVAAELPDRTGHLVAHAVDAALDAASLTRDRLHRAVIGTPGAVDPGTGVLRYAPHLPGWHSREPAAEIAAVVGVPVVIENDVNLAALAERHHGAARGHEDFVLLWADAGVGAAIVLGGRLLRGATGGAGEVGYLPVPGAPLVRGEDARSSGFQQLVGAPRVVELARSQGFGDVTTLDDALGHSPVREEVAHRLAVGLAAVVAVVDPRLVVLSGSVAHAGGEGLRAAVEREMTGLALPRPELRISEVQGDPILAGALHTALDAARDSVFDTSRSTPAPA
ncbi:ROK family transcriptional regulator [Streptomyces sp. NPDC059740]|uniref:ROK family transcriptional regulator n=1 Tax=Streptomyces sp. NPDC059740 TaxID=3346926 RepID=UPI00365EAFBA